VGEGGGEADACEGCGELGWSNGHFVVLRVYLNDHRVQTPPVRFLYIC
jgi:hypothetical protein